MVKLKVNQRGFLVSIPSVGSFRSPFEIKIPDSFADLVRVELLKNGIKDFKISESKKESKIKSELVEQKIGESVEEKKESDSLSADLLSVILDRLDYLQYAKENPKVEEPKVEEKKELDLSVILDRLGYIQSLVHEILLKDPTVLSKDKIVVVEDQDIFIPTSSVSGKDSIMDLTVKISEKDNLDSRVELLSNLERKS